MSTTNESASSGTDVSDVSENEQKSPYRSAHGLAPVESDHFERERRAVGHGAPRRAAENFDGEVTFSPDHDTRDVPDHADDMQWSNEGTDLPEPLRKPSDGVAARRFTDGGFNHGSRAATGWYKSDVPDGRADRFGRLHALQHDKMGVRDSESDSKAKKREEGLWCDLTNLGLRGTDRQRAYRLATTDPYRTSSWASHHSGFVGLAIGYGAVVTFDSEEEARHALLGDTAFADVATTLMDKPDALSAVSYAFERAEERGLAGGS